MRRVAGPVLVALALLAIWLCARAVRDEDGTIRGRTASAPPPATTPAGAARDASSSPSQAESTGQRAPQAASSTSSTVEHRVGVHDAGVDDGPTYSVDLVLPAGLRLDDLRARLFLDPPGFDDDVRSAPETSVRAPHDGATLASVRFDGRKPVEGTPLWLELASTDGLWTGGARVPGGPGAHPDPVRIELEARCAVRGRCVTARHEPATGALALLRVEDPLALRWGHTDAEGRFRFAGLEPGDHRLEIRDEALRGEPVAFALPAGDLDLGDVRCEPIPLAGSVRLRVQSSVEVPIDVELVRTFDPPRHPLWHSDSWEPLPGGGFESLFEWDEVHAGKLAIDVHSHDLGEWRFSLGEIEPPVEELTLRLPAPPPPLGLDVVDAASGAVLDDWTVLVRGERSWDEPDGARDSLALWSRATPFAVLGPGHRAWVMGRAMAPRPDRITVPLERGWSHLFLARTRSHGRPVANVAIRLDGVAAGTTDPSGELWVHADSPAQHLEISHPGLVWANEDEVALDELVSWILLRP